MVSVIIPARNEAANLGELFEALDKCLVSLAQDFEVVLVNDGSVDATEQMAREATRTFPWLHVTGSRVQGGVAEALRTGFHHARGDVLVIFPADLQYHPDSIVVLTKAIAGGADLVAGWRQGKYQRPLSSKAANWLVHRLFPKVKIHDINSIKAVKRNVLSSFAFRHNWHRFIALWASEKGFSVEERQVDLYPRRHGVSKFKGTMRLWSDFLDLLSFKLLLTFSSAPMTLFGTLGAASTAIGTICMGIKLYNEFCAPLPLTPSGAFSALFITIGVVLVCIGFIAELIVTTLTKEDSF
jgi:glycosyltransferase involved in cell wall biosynthesis